MIIQNNLTKILLLFHLLCNLFISQSAAEITKPDMVVEIFRHGARAPSNLKFDSSWPVAGDLTSTGIRQLYILGVLMGQKYSHLLDKYNPNSIFVRTSGSSRTIMSASAHLYGVFQGKGPSLQSMNSVNFTIPPFDDAISIDQVVSTLVNITTATPLGFQPPIIQTIQRQEDKMLFVGPWSCYNMGVWQKERETDVTNTEVLTFLNETVTQLRKLGYDIKTFADLADFGDTLIDNYQDNRPMPKGIEFGSSVYLDSVFAFQWFSNYNYLGYGMERVLKALHLLSQIVDWFEGAAKGTNPIKFAFLSAHDTTLLPLLGLYNITDPNCLFENYKSQKAGKPVVHPECVYPIFASQIIYEFYNKTEGPYIKFLYNGKPLKLNKTSDSYEISLSDFAKQSRALLMNLTQNDYDHHCNPILPPTDKSQSASSGSDGLVFWLIGMIIILFLIIGGLLALLFKDIREKKSPDSKFYKLFELENL